MKNSYYLLLLLVFCLLLPACSEEEAPGQQIPFVPVYVEINLQDLRYQSLHNQGWVYLNGGVRGLVLVKESNSRYIALERACPHHPSEECAQVEMHSSGFYLTDSCCGSQFDKSGQVTKGPAQRSLLQYNTYQTGNILIIQNQQ